MNQDYNGLGNDSTHQKLQYTQILQNSIEPFGKYEGAIFGKTAKKTPEGQSQNRAFFHMIRDALPTGVNSQGEDVHLTAISSEMEAQIADNRKLGGPNVSRRNTDIGEVNRALENEQEIHLTNISNRLAQKHNPIENSEHSNLEKHLNGETIRDEILEASLAPKVQ